MRADSMTEISVEQRGDARWITLDRPERRNAISPVMLDEIDQAVRAAEQDRSVRVLVFAASGSVFCAGADLGDAEALPDSALLERSTALMNRIEDFPQPVVAMVQGLACAGGVELLLACDLIVASDRAAFADIHSTVGLIPGAGGVWRLVRRVGLAWAKQMMYSGDIYSSEDMYVAGFVNEVTPADQLETRTVGLVDMLSSRSPLALAAMKRLANGALDATREEHMSAALAENDRHLRTTDGGEGLAAMSEKRQPVYVWQ
ncbi:enoyl-CoA hydratase/isomerase family protein [Microbacterium suaedae]|uniref:enoyl-CoA hydratase/isomerase family protein n=1 Tax=Microbacterium suaedae TaxID=2067813 RepID=UPI000DA161CF|nr:enoyl-CoA hydratase/isomerase family protein [Microbacterium suaedae]